MTSITSHVLDTAAGRPASGVSLALAILKGEGWEPVARAVTDEDGRVQAWSPETPLGSGTYRIRFQMGAYFERQGHPAFHPWVDVVFACEEPEGHYHVPLLVSPFGYTTYRGS